MNLAQMIDPEFVQSGAHRQAPRGRPAPEPEPERAAVKPARKLGVLSMAILAALHYLGEASAAEIRAVTGSGSSETLLWKTLAQLVKSGRVQRSGSHGCYRYRLPE